MPKSTYFHLPARFSQLTRYTVRCRNCGQDNSYYEHQLDADEPVYCRACKGANFPFVFHKVHLACDGCGGRLQGPVVREGLSILYFHPECAAIYDSILAVFQQQSLRLALNAVTNLNSEFGAELYATKVATATHKSLPSSQWTGVSGSPATAVASARVFSALGGCDSVAQPDVLNVNRHRTVLAVS